MAERFLELARQADGSFTATFADDRPPVRVAGWADIRRLRDRHHLLDHWSGQDRSTFIGLYGHPFDDWWARLSPSTREAFMADPLGPIPAQRAEELKRSLRQESGRDGLRVEGSFFTAEVREYIVARAAERPVGAGVERLPEHGA